MSCEQRKMLATAEQREPQMAQGKLKDSKTNRPKDEETRARDERASLFSGTAYGCGEAARAVGATRRVDGRHMSAYLVIL